MNTTSPAAVAERRFAPCKFIRSHSTDWLSAAAHVRPSQKKKDVPLRPILSMTSSAQHQLAKYLSSLFETGSHSLFEQLHTGLFHLS